MRSAYAIRSWGPLENLTLTDGELDQPIRGEGGKALRAKCPFHGSDHQRSLRVNLETGHFKCHACSAWGYLDSHRKQGLADRPRIAGAPVRQPIPRTPTPPQPRPELAAKLAEYQKALPGSPAEAYLKKRSIPLELAQRLGAGYAASGSWLGREWRQGRIVFPHTTPEGEIVNLYGRALGNVPEQYKSLKHDHLSGAKGYVNAQALREGEGPIAICEGVFDLLAIMAAGQERALAIFGLDGWRWEWAKDAGELILALDNDEPGREAAGELARSARLRGKRVALLDPEAYAGAKDIAEAWAAGSFRLGAWPGIVAENSTNLATNDTPENWTPAYEKWTHSGSNVELEEPPKAHQTRQEAARVEASTKAVDTTAAAAVDSGANREAVEAMRWEDALEACEELATDDFLAGCTLSYAYLDQGPEGLQEIRQELAADVAGIDAGAALGSLGVELLAWKRAVYMARRRAFDDLPEAWQLAQSRALHRSVKIEGVSVLIDSLDDRRAERVLEAVKEKQGSGRFHTWRSGRYGKLRLTFQEMAAATEAARIASHTIDRRAK